MFCGAGSGGSGVSGGPFFRALTSFFSRFGQTRYSLRVVLAPLGWFCRGFKKTVIDSGWFCVRQGGFIEVLR